jgi:hypothetical protein
MLFFALATICYPDAGFSQQIFEKESVCIRLPIKTISRIQPSGFDCDSIEYPQLMGCKVHLPVVLNEDWIIESC